jgi:hypothetical protein
MELVQMQEGRDGECGAAVKVPGTLVRANAQALAWRLVLA